MFVHFGMLLANGSTGATGSLARLDLVVKQAPIRFGLAYQNGTSRLANQSTIEIGTDALGEVLHHILCQTSIGTGSAGCCTNNRGFNAVGSLFAF
jgi:hypothetical protein